jgi:GNAT superfamily N-acetyltransferase
MLKTDTQQQFIIDKFHSDDEADLLDMNVHEYGPRDSIISPEAFHWLFAENPAGLAEITIARNSATGRLAGFTWTIPVCMRLYGKDLVAVLTANQVVHPEYRSTMVYARISRSRMQWLREHRVPFRYNFPTEAIYASTGKAEKMSSVLIPLLIRPVDTVPLAQRLLKKHGLSTLLGWGAKLFTPILYTSKPMVNRHDPLIIEQLDRFDERFDVFWRRVQDKYAVMTVRNRSFLSWRFAPVAGKVYHILAAVEQDHLIGYVILRVTDEIRGIPTGLVMDVLLEPGERGEFAGRLLLEEAWKYFQKEKAWLAGALALPHTAEYAILLRAGYRPLPKRLAPRLFRVAFNCFSEDLPATSQVTESDLFFSIADYEAH